MAKVRVNWGSRNDGSAVAIYEVSNTSNKSLLILASDEKTAMKIAHTANHIYDLLPKIALSYSRLVGRYSKDVESFPHPYQGALRTAIERRLQGTLHFDDGRVSIGDEVIA